MNNLLIVADVDGTLLDSRGKLPVPARELRTRLARVADARDAIVTLALASSRTLRELRVLQRALGTAGPLIAEDGAVVASGDSVWRPGTDHRTLREMLSTIEPVLSTRVLDVSQRTKLHALGFRSVGAQRRAIGAREASLLLDLSEMPEETRVSSIATCTAHGLTIHRGGRWFTVTRGAGKGAALEHVRQLLRARGVEADVVAVGNEENDATLLAASDAGFAINNPGRGVHPSLRALPNVTALGAVGTAGFVELLERLTRSAQEEAA